MFLSIPQESCAGIIPTNLFQKCTYTVRFGLKMFLHMFLHGEIWARNVLTHGTDYDNTMFRKLNFH